jgi:cytidyltransferase-like protein
MGIQPVEKEKRIYVGGTFDCLHSGHVNLFMQAHSLGHCIVSLNTDEFAASYKRKPLIPLRERLVVVGTNKFVDTVMINSGGADSKPAILASNATHIMHGDDWTGEEYYKQLGITEEWLKENNIEVIYTPYTKNISTSQLLKGNTKD